MTARAMTSQLLVALAAAGLVVSVPAFADAGSGQMASCAERGNPLDCVPTMTAANAAEAAYLTDVHGRLKSSDADLLRTGRLTCNMFVYAGQPTGDAVNDIANSLKVNKASATFVMDMAMVHMCPGLSIGADGVPRPHY
ncbi:DUF732 domain-containing protein [Mycobacterium sp. CBMA293]|uniref:DUF732 domain-containing protein n=2 Tax=Mycolicibacterium TaxID=1866885 RepID=UPI0012DDD23B|nr:MULTISPECIES: DUF732 domain-containing protein [unclassified Mycolicibacterium]MUM30582.1 DUF732 domain-containing protein [Mycolicibacterium sp. CBMA 361]MUL47876.1 DUF732 domain-containing protein [Mycolicibacterium sp. CBMA 360]MUL59276.1 DUF732 domain-containing protein [Mycolicibacterium sp. CBMA 335]MUL71001.1 DUF732 domain-containing protein [Mycolicibacterium sp. CBMA 311]MUL94644.1 DUF732 domain-containing protein [Mycolicibacterium sp. CBMA 230]